MRGLSSGIFVISIIVCVIVNCTPNPYAKTNRQHKKQTKHLAKTLRQLPKDMRSDSLNSIHQWVGTTNFNLRKPNFVIIHHTAQNSCDQTLRTFTLPRTQVSAHYVICKDGTIQHMLNDYLRAWHAGIGKWGNVTDINSTSIGIELDNNGFEFFSDYQMNSLMRLLDTLKRKYAIPSPNFIGHSDIAPTRKSDPSIYFPWKLLADNGFGLWYGDTTGISVPETFNNLQALRIIGYDVADSTAAIIAFKRHFLQDTIAMLYEADRKILYNLFKLY